MNIDRPLGGTQIIRTIGKTMTRSVAVLALLLTAQPTKAQTILPSDVAPSCTVPAADFKRWFATGNPTKDGIVLPAGSLTFTPDSACSFYKWSQQMFLWLTSPVGGGRHVFSSPQFFGVEAPALDGTRKLVPQENNTLLSFAPAISLVGGKGINIVADDTGKIRNVVRAQAPGSTLLFRDKADKPVDVAHVAAAAGGKPLLLDKTNTVLDVQTTESGAPLLRDSAGKALSLADSTVQVDGVQRLVTTSGDVVELGQAGGNAVLMTRNNGLVYYLLQVNDVFAYFKTGMTDGKFSAPLPTEFPIDASLLGKIADVAKNAPAPFTRTGFQDNVALSMELKSSWVEASKLGNPQDYLTIKATIPNFVPSGTNKLMQSGTKNVDLALVGFHVVGSAAGHPEMIWATFEHVSNTPNLAYPYKTASGTTVTNPADNVGPWLFSTSAPSATPLAVRMTSQNNGAEIVANGQQTIGPIDVTRQKPWGTVATDATAADNNTDIISIDRSVIGQMAAGDVRANYIMIGSTWTFDGKPPGTNIAGSLTLANSTMETFKQKLNCFTCHQGDMLGVSKGGGLSHIWGDIQPLFP